jgi:hypothetical protein
VSAALIDPLAVLRKHFCANAANDPRDYLHHPHPINGRAWASNGHWMGLIDSLPVGTDLPECKVPAQIVQAIDAIDCYTGDFVAASTVGIASSECSQCHGTGRARERECDECDGDGFFYHGSHLYDCKACNGEGTRIIPGGYADCLNCAGSGTTLETKPSTHFDPGTGYTANGMYIAALREIGGEISARTTTAACGALWIVRFPGGRGALMPMHLGSSPPLRLEDSDLAPPAIAAEGSAA